MGFGSQNYFKCVNQENNEHGCKFSITGLLKRLGPGIPYSGEHFPNINYISDYMLSIICALRYHWDLGSCRIFLEFG